MDKLDSLRAFTRVVKDGSFAAAARSMNLSRSVVNRAVINLEKDLNALLLQRSTRQVTPTEIGLAFHDRCQRILADLDEAILSVAEENETPIGNLRINAPMSFGTLHLSKIVADFMVDYPKVHIELVLNDRFIDPIEEGFDVTLRVGTPQVRSSLIAKRITSAKRVLCASPKYLEEHGEPVHPNELKDHRCLHYGYQESGSQWRLQSQKQEYVVLIGCVMFSNNGEILKDAAINNQGIALLPTFIVGSALQRGDLVTVMTDYAPPEIDLCALYPRHRHLSTKVRLFVELLIERFGVRPYWDLVT